MKKNRKTYIQFEVCQIEVYHGKTVCTAQVTHTDDTRNLTRYARGRCVVKNADDAYLDKLNKELNDKIEHSQGYPNVELKFVDKLIRSTKRRIAIRNFFYMFRL